MNKTDYEVIAHWLLLHRPSGTEEATQYWYNMVLDLCDILKARNPRFDTIKFLGESGYHV
jgi:hypothetical protein